MNKEFVPYEEALALKELGFRGRIFVEFHDTNRGTCYELTRYIDDVDVTLWCVTYGQAFQWFREGHNLQAEILYAGDRECFVFKTGRFKRGSHTIWEKESKPTHEECELACLRKLISIIKEQQ